jgi:putative peptidoglycan lipid II flippase
LSIIQTCHDLLFVGTLGACVVPLLAHADEHTEHRKSDADFATTLAWATGAIALLLAALLWSWLPAILDALAPGMSELTRTTALLLGRALVLMLPLNALVTLFSLVLTVRNRFVSAALPAFLTNVLFIAMVATLSSSLDQNALLIACYAGPLISVALLMLQSIRLGLLGPIVPRAPLRVISAVWPLSWPALATAGLGSSLGLIMASHVIVRSFAAAHGDGAIAAVSYAFKIYEVPLTLIVNPSAMILFPMLASMRSAGQTREFGHLIRRLLVWGLILLFPICVVTWLGGRHHRRSLAPPRPLWHRRDTSHGRCVARLCPRDCV